MKTTLKTLICAALCCAASAAFAITPPPNAQTSIAFNNNPATLVPGADVIINTVSMPTGVDPLVTQAVVDEGSIEIQVATDGLGDLVPAGAGVTWVGLDVLGNQSLSGTGGVLNIPIDLDNISSLSSTALINPSCPASDGTMIGFRAHYITGGGMVHADNHFS